MTFKSTWPAALEHVSHLGLFDVSLGLNSGYIFLARSHRSDVISCLVHHIRGHMTSVHPITVMLAMITWWRWYLPGFSVVKLLFFLLKLRGDTLILRTFSISHHPCTHQLETLWFSTTITGNFFSKYWFSISISLYLHLLTGILLKGKVDRDFLNLSVPWFHLVSTTMKISSRCPKRRNFSKPGKGWEYTF